MDAENFALSALFIYNDTVTSAEQNERERKKKEKKHNLNGKLCVVVSKFCQRLLYFYNVTRFNSTQIKHEFGYVHKEITTFREAIYT